MIFNLLGFKWCGAGNKSIHGETGFFAADDCCRVHDFCPHHVWSAGQSKLNVTNPFRFFSLSDCRCDDELLECLSQRGASGEVVAETFKLFISQCAFFANYKLVCQKTEKRKCVQYQKPPRARRGPSFYQLRDNPPPAFPFISAFP